MQKTQITGGLMNPVTRKIRNKGYTLNEFCELIGYSLRWYRTHANKDSKQGKQINNFVCELKEQNND